MTRFALLSFALALSLVTPAALAAGPKPGEEVKWDGTLKDTSDKEHKRADWKDKVVVVVFWGRDPSSRSHAPRLLELKKNLGGKVTFLAVVPGKLAQRAEQIKTTQKLNLPVLRDADKSLVKALGARMTPTAFVIGKDGKLAYRGNLDNDPRGDNPKRENYLADALTAILSGRTPEKRETPPSGGAIIP